MTSHQIHQAEGKVGPTSRGTSGLRQLTAAMSQLQKSLQDLDERVRKLESIFNQLSTAGTSSESPRESAATALELLARLTQRDRDILIAFARQPHDAVVAVQLGCKRQTISNRLANIQRKLQVTSRTHLLQFVYRQLPALTGEATGVTE